MTGGSQESEPGTGPRWHWLLPLLAVAALVVIVVVRFQQQDRSARRAAETAQQAVSEGVVQLETDYADGVQKRLTALPWRAGMTVADAMELAAAHQRGIRYNHEGVGADALLVSIDGLKNEGGGSSSRNWIYRINGEQGDRSFAVYELQSGDTVLWSFTTYE